MILTKTDLLPHVDFDPKLALDNARKIHPEIEYIALSSRTGGIRGMAGLAGGCRRGAGGGGCGDFVMGFWGGAGFSVAGFNEECTD